ncbi:unnamed protein product, partial [Didymodactylos carnosus]
QALHPMPAVGGLTQSDALKLLREKENLDRGWVAALLQWSTENVIMSNHSTAVLDYERHTNLAVNTKTADECRNLSELRREIDTIDHLIVKLIHHRLDYALAALKFKLDGKPIPDNRRIIQQLIQRREWAENYGLDRTFIESLFKSMIDWYMSQQIAYYKMLHPGDASAQFKICSLAELKAVECDLEWIDVLHYGQLLRSAYRKAEDLAEPIL